MHCGIFLGGLRCFLRGLWWFAVVSLVCGGLRYFNGPISIDKSHSFGPVADDSLKLEETKWRKTSIIFQLSIFLYESLVKF